MISNVPKTIIVCYNFILMVQRQIISYFSANKKSKEKINLNKLMKSNNYLNNKSLSTVKTAQKMLQTSLFKTKSHLVNLN